MRFDDIFLVLLHGLSDCTKRDGLPRLGFCCGSTSMCLPFEAGLIFYRGRGGKPVFGSVS